MGMLEMGVGMAASGLSVLPEGGRSFMQLSHCVRSSSWVLGLGSGMLGDRGVICPRPTLMH